MAYELFGTERTLKALLVGISGAMIAIACGGGSAKTPVTVKTTDGGAEAAVSPFATTPPPSGLPPMAKMPPPGVTGSKRAKTRAMPAMATCSGSAKPQAKDPADFVKRIGDGCAAASKMKPLGTLLRGQQGDKDAHQENKFHAEANHCYRLYFASEEAAKDVVVVLRDSAGDIVAEAPGPSVPEDGIACFTASDDVSVLVGIGAGKGAWAAQVWSD